MRSTSRPARRARTACSRTTGSACITTGRSCSTRCWRRAAGSSAAWNCSSRSSSRAALRCRGCSTSAITSCPGVSWKAPAASCSITRPGSLTRACRHARMPTCSRSSAKSSATSRSPSMRRTARASPSITRTCCSRSGGTARSSVPRPFPNRSGCRCSSGCRPAAARSSRSLAHRWLCFAGNALELAAADGTAVLAMSDRASRSLDARSLETLRHCVERVVAVPVPTIEDLGGGSVRCTLAEVFLPRRAAAT